MKEILWIILLAIIGFGIMHALITKQERNECVRWASSDYTLWQDWQRDQCHNYGFELAKPKGWK